MDAGGTKTNVLLLDSDYLPVAGVTTGSLRDYSSDGTTGRQNLIELCEKLEGLGLREIESFCGVCPMQKSAFESFSDRFHIRNLYLVMENDIGLAAALIPNSSAGTLMLSGTGCGIYSRIKENDHRFTGGYGAAFSDIGSGYYIGREAFIAAEKDFEGFGKKTVLTEKIASFLGYEKLNEAIFQGVFGSKSTKTPTSVVASFAGLVSEAAREGDEVALAILTDAGKIVGEMTVAHRRRYALSDEVPITYSGGVWHAHPIFRETAISTVLAALPASRIVDPLLEPIGGAVAFMRMAEKGENEDLRPFFEKNYPKWLYRP